MFFPSSADGVSFDLRSSMQPSLAGLLARPLAETLGRDRHRKEVWCTLPPAALSISKPFSNSLAAEVHFLEVGEGLFGRVVLPTSAR